MDSLGCESLVPHLLRKETPFPSRGPFPLISQVNPIIMAFDQPQDPSNLGHPLLNKTLLVLNQHMNLVLEFWADPHLLFLGIVVSFLSGGCLHDYIGSPAGLLHAIEVFFIGYLKIIKI